MKIKEVINAIEAYHPFLPNYCGCDGIKAGDSDVECTGIVTSLVPTIDVIRKTAALGYNMLYIHEPSYYMTPDFPEWRGCFDNTVYDAKRKLLSDTGIVVYRDHDHTHAHKPDGIFSGVMKYLGWEPYYREDIGRGMEYVFDIPEITLHDLIQQLIDTIGMNGTRYIGDPDAKIHRIAIVAHLYPENGFAPVKEKDGYYTDYSTEIIRIMEEDGVEAIIPGEIIEWNVLSYIRDAVQFGKTKACINIGHFNFEALGARYAADWISGLVKQKVPIQYIYTGDMWEFQMK